MARHFTKRWSIITYLVGGILFLIGSGRFIVRDDPVGAVILAFAGSLALLMAAVNYARQNRKP